MSNLSNKTKTIQRAVGVAADGVYGENTANAIISHLRPDTDAGQPMEMKEPEKFFSSIRSMFSGTLETSQVDGINAKLSSFGKACWPISWASYAMATSYHETAKTMQPVEEAYWLSDDWRKQNLRYYPWHGRGDVQLTWEYNYKKADEKLGLSGSLIANPERALEPKISADVMVYGMQEGWFTNHSLGQHLPDDLGTQEQFESARRIINGTDKKSEIAGIAKQFQDAFIAGKWRSK
ncbi:MAG: hypothetical protein HRU18_25760 [Pseudoalteromonas sp.]|uniref:hypothetical protein n=1 Tax=Pseudoalteromonas sp. TaxID=53249 RepID=UPI001D7C1126|nr:hypothetical protein [Pseudoalteromonas sp.]NRA81619.1 hypothetical protein [Pseudoalteromonas sp.]